MTNKTNLNEGINNGPMIKFLGIKIFYPNLRNLLVLTMLIIICLVLALSFSYLRRVYPEYFGPFIEDFQSFNFTVPINFNSKDDYKDRVNALSKNIDKKSKDNNSRIQVSFWTPDENTWQSIRSHTADNGWQKAVTAETVINFMDIIFQPAQKDSMFKGLRNYKVCGRGSETYKCGTWWVSNANEGFKLNQFIEVYKNFWKSSPGIYLELSLIKNQYSD